MQKIFLTTIILLSIFSLAFSQNCKEKIDELKKWEDEWNGPLLLKFVQPLVDEGCLDYKKTIEYYVGINKNLRLKEEMSGITASLSGSKGNSYQEQRSMNSYVIQNLREPRKNTNVQLPEGKGVKLINTNNFDVFYAVGFYENSVWKVNGWFKIESNKFMFLTVESDIDYIYLHFSNSEFGYTYSVSSNNNFSNFCVHESNKFNGVWTETCESGLVLARFGQVAIGENFPQLIVK